MIASFSFGKAYNWKLPDNSIPKEYPDYLLVIRYWGSKLQQEGDIAYSIQTWIYSYEVYDSLDEVINRLNTYCGQGMTAEDKETDLVGLWRLGGQEQNILDKVIQIDEIPHEKEVKIETREWIEYQWKKK